jgi:ABC-2 type transport system ATP-binding protein
MPYTRCMAYTIEIEGLRRSFGAHTVLAGVDLRVVRGSITALLGANGAGKTTTVRILATLLPPDAGRVVVAGHDVRAAPAAVRRVVSTTGQGAAVDDVLTGRENLVMAGRLRRLTRAAARRRADELLERFDLTDAADRRVATYSGGMARRLDLALGMVDDPEVLLLDEPTTGLDPRARRDVWARVAELAAAGVTVLLTTQYLEEAEQLADHVAVLHGGHLVAEGTAEELKARSGGETVELVLSDGGVLADTAHLARAHGYIARVDEETPSLHVSTDGTPAAVRALLEAVADLPVQRIAVHRPTLDDVFLALTSSDHDRRAVAA